jgi:hypothetical protein
MTVLVFIAVSHLQLAAVTPSDLPYVETSASFVGVEMTVETPPSVALALLEQHGASAPLPMQLAFRRSLSRPLRTRCRTTPIRGPPRTSS